MGGAGCHPFRSFQGFGGDSYVVTRSDKTPVHLAKETVTLLLMFYCDPIITNPCSCYQSICLENSHVIGNFITSRPTVFYSIFSKYFFLFLFNMKLADVLFCFNFILNRVNADKLYY